MNEYFKSEGHKIAFALKFLDGKARMDVLGITYQHFSSKKVAKKWYDETKQILTNENLLDEFTNEKLEKVYREMK